MNIGQSFIRLSLPTLGLAAGLTACGASRPSVSDLKIVGGAKVAATDVIVKSTVALVSPQGDQFCTGSLIAAKYVVTASHCLDDLPWSQFYVAFGPTAKPGSFTASRLRSAIKAQMNEAYDREQMNADEASAPPNDIGLVTLSAVAPAGYAPIAMMGANDELRVGETLTLAGFGVTRATAQTSGILYKVNTDLTKVDDVAHEIHFGGHRGKSACMGDSGGPAFVTRNNKLVLVGITSRGSSICDEDGIYTDVRYQLRWIANAERN